MKIFVFLFQEEGVAGVAELHKKSDPVAKDELNTVLKEFCMDARYSDHFNSSLI